MFKIFNKETFIAENIAFNTRVNLFLVFFLGNSVLSQFHLLSFTLQLYLPQCIALCSMKTTSKYDQLLIYWLYTRRTLVRIKLEINHIEIFYTTDSFIDSSLDEIILDWRLYLCFRLSPFVSNKLVRKFSIRDVKFSQIEAYWEKISNLLQIFIASVIFQPIWFIFC